MKRQHKKVIPKKKPDKNSFYKYYKDSEEAKIKAKAETLTKLKNLQFATKVNINDLISDTRFFKLGIIRRIRDRLTHKALVQCIIHMDSGNDVVRNFPIYRNNVVDINNKYYMFSPDSFRFINGLPTLYFYQGVPFAILHKTKERIPTLDAKAFTSIQRSKFITDALEGEDPNIGSVLLWIAVGMTFLTLMGVIITLVMMMDKFKALGI